MQMISKYMQLQGLTMFASHNLTLEITFFFSWAGEQVNYRDSNPTVTGENICCEYTANKCIPQKSIEICMKKKRKDARQDETPRTLFFSLQGNFEFIGSEIINAVFYFLILAGSNIWDVHFQEETLISWKKKAFTPCEAFK